MKLCGYLSSRMTFAAFLRLFSVRSMKDDWLTAVACLDLVGDLVRQQCERNSIHRSMHTCPYE